MIRDRSHSPDEELFEAIVRGERLHACRFQALISDGISLLLGVSW